MLKTTPLHSRTSALMQANQWRRWAGYSVASSYEMTHDREYYAIRNACVLLDVSPLCKYSIKGADALKSSGMAGTPVLLAFVLLTASVNLFMGSASAKWALMAPVFVPMLMLNDIPPDVTQCAYRVGDSCTNIISPMMSYFALIIAFFQRYDSKAGIGTLVATMLPYTLAFLVSWSLFFAIWVKLGWPLGPG